jgi:acetyltransferase-like isoleucine patch superfamily enzyme
MVKNLLNNLFNFLKFHHKKGVIIKKDCYIKNCNFEGKCVINKGNILSNSKIGFGTYLGSNNFFPYTRFGRYCSIGSNSKVIYSTHPTNTYVSTSPVFFSLGKQSGFTFVKEQKFDELMYIDKDKEIVLDIGNDVWIGDDVTILGGVKIGDGAIIGTKALITKDIPPYAIVGGIPAKVIKYRFNQEQIDFLNELKWWNYDESWLKANVHLFNNIDNFMMRLKFNEQEKNKSMYVGD